MNQSAAQIQAHSPTMKLSAAEQERTALLDSYFGGNGAALAFFWGADISDIQGEYELLSSLPEKSKQEIYVMEGLAHFFKRRTSFDIK